MTTNHTGAFFAETRQKSPKDDNKPKTHSKPLQALVTHLVTRVEFLLGIIPVILFFILPRLSSISSCLRERFPTEFESDYEWSQKDPAGHWEADKNDKK
jgi:hypothetical protein